MDEVLHFGLQTPPSELDSDQFVCTHVRTVCLQLILWRRRTKTEAQFIHRGSDGTEVRQKHGVRLSVNYVRYLPFGAKRSSARLGGVEKSGIFFWLIVLKKRKKGHQNVKML